MKKQFLIFATITTIVFTSCSKEKIEAPQTNQPEEIATATQRTEKGDLSKGLLGLYEFNGNLVEKTGKLYTGSPNGTVSYTADRKGLRGRAVKFNGALDISVGYIPHSVNMSVAAWVKYDNENAPFSQFICSQSDGPRFAQLADQYYVWNSPFGNPNLTSGTINNQWHFLTATIDGVNLRMYVDGMFVGSVASPDVENLTTAIYMLGYGNTTADRWRGAIDDLRFYSRTLSDSEVKALFNL